MILYRYIIRELIPPFFYSFAIAIFMFTMQLAVNLLRKILFKGLALSTIVELFLISMAWMVVLSVPAAVLVATLTTFGKMSADNEILAIKASGQNLFYLITPVFVAASILTVSLIFFHNLILPNANHRYASLRSDISRKKPAALIEPNILIKDFDNYRMIVNDVEHSEGVLRGIKIFSNMPGEDPATTIADSGTLLLTNDEKYLQLTLYNGETHSTNKDDEQEYFVGSFKKHMIFIPNVDSRLKRTDRGYRGDREKSAKELLLDVNGFKESKKQAFVRYSDNLDDFIKYGFTYDSILADTGVSVDSIGDSLAQADTTSDSVALAAWAQVDSIQTFEQWHRAMLKHRHGAIRHFVNNKHVMSQTKQQVKRYTMKISQYMVEVHKKYSISFACIVFILIGIPLGIIARHGSIAVGVTYSIFFFVLYWSFLIAGENLADRLITPPGITMWSSNIVIGAFGLILTLRMMRESTFINYGPIVQFWQKITSIFRPAKHHRSILSTVVQLPVRICNRLFGVTQFYLVRIFVKNSIIVFASLVVVFIVIDYISNMRGFSKATFIDVVEYYWYYLAWFLGLIFPIGFLLSSMMSMVALAKNSELTAIKAAGISFTRLTIPMLFIGIFLSVSSFYLGEKILPEANASRKQLWEDIKAGTPREKRGVSTQYSPRELKRDFFFFVGENTTYRFGQFRAEPQLAHRVSRVVFSGNRIVENLTAEKMVYVENQWAFINGRIKSFADERFVQTTFDTLPDSTLTVPPGEMTARLTRSTVDYMSYWELKNHLQKAISRGEKASEFIADLQFKLALPVMNFIVILLGLSITARAGRKGGAVSFGIGLLLVFTYWVMSQFGLALGKKEVLNPIFSAWIGNILFFIIGIFLYKGASR